MEILGSQQSVISVRKGETKTPWPTNEMPLRENAHEKMAFFTPIQLVTIADQVHICDQEHPGSGGPMMGSSSSLCVNLASPTYF